jgi:hypothetical protein
MPIITDLAQHYRPEYFNTWLMTNMDAGLSSVVVLQGITLLDAEDHQYQGLTYAANLNDHFMALAVLITWPATGTTRARLIWSNSAPFRSPTSCPTGRCIGLGGQIICQLGEKLPVSPEEVTLTRRLLIAAGYREDHHLAAYFDREHWRCSPRIAGVLLPALYRDIHAAYCHIHRCGRNRFFSPRCISNISWINARRFSGSRCPMHRPDGGVREAGLGLDQAINVVSRDSFEPS